MDLEKVSIIYEEINEKNKFLFEDYEKNKFHKYGIVSFTDEETDDMVDYVKVKYCVKRNICRLYNPEKNDMLSILGVVLRTLDGFLPSDCLIWYCVDNYLEYTEHGFKNPYYCKYDPFGVEVDEKIAISKVNDPFFETNDRDRHNGNDSNPDKFQLKRTSPTREHKLDIFGFIEERYGEEDPIKLKMRFNEDDLKYLQKLVFSGRTMNGDGTMTQKEVSGILCLERKRNYLEVKIDQTKNFNAHDEEKVRFVNGLINFHTHPLEVYNTYGVDLMYPSPSDYMSILNFMIQEYSFCDNSFWIYPLLFSCVVTVEGVYIISLNKKYCNSASMKRLRDTIAEKKDGCHVIKQGVRDSLNSKSKGVSGYFYGGNRDTKQFYDTHCRYIGDPKDHPLGYTQVGGIDFDTYKHNRRESNLHHFPESCEKDGHDYSRVEQAAKDYCIKMNRRQLITGTRFEDGPVFHVQYYTYDELENKSFYVYTKNCDSDYVPPQLLLNEETLNKISLFSRK